MPVEWFGQELSELPAEYERVIPPPGKTLVFTVSGWLLGYKTVHVKPGYAARQKPAIGLTVHRLDKPDAITHWCIIGAEPVANLEQELAAAAGTNRVYSLSVSGKSPLQHWSIGASPAPGA